MTRTRVVIPFAIVGADQNPNAAKLAEGEQLAAYARGAAVTFAALRRWAPELDLVWATNGPVPPALREVLVPLDVRVDTFPFRHEPPDHYMRAFKGCLFMLDAMESYRGESVLYLDPDVLSIKPLTSMLDGLGDRVGALPMNFPVDEDVNGVDAAMARRILASRGVDQFGGFIGGEAIWIPASSADFVDDVLDWHEDSLARFRRGEDHFSTEEHLFSAVLSTTPYVSLEPYVRRIWTTSRYRTVNGAENDLTLWHLPAEKDRGFRFLYDIVRDRSSWFWNADQEEFAAHAGKALSLHHRAPRKLARDAAGSAANWVQGWRGRSSR